MARQFPCKGTCKYMLLAQLIILIPFWTIYSRVIQSISSIMDIHCSTCILTHVDISLLQATDSFSYDTFPTRNTRSCKQELTPQRITTESANVGQDILANTKINTTVAPSITVPMRQLTEGEIKQRFDRRKLHLQRQCDAYNVNNKPPICGNHFGNLLDTTKDNLLYCAIEKAGSTFWRRILQVIGSDKAETNPTLIKTGRAYSEDGYTSLHDANLSTVDGIFKHSTSVIFVRNPFSRLFSGWLDKLYNPNAYYWQGLGKKIVQSQRPDMKNANISCGFDVTFSELVSHISDEIITGKCLDGHFAPNHEHCDPCHHQYTYVGKYESLKDDTLYLMNNLKLNKQVEFNDFETDAATDAIRDATDWAFGQKEPVSKCNVSFHCALFKVWNRLQSRGIVSINFEFPLTLKQTNTINKDTFFGILLAANIKSSKEELKAGRKMAYAQAIKSLSKELVGKVQLAFKLDFQLFDYDPDPLAEIYSNSDTTLGQYFKECPT